jgi:hypothetical protein
MNPETGAQKISGGEREIANPMKGGEGQGPRKTFLEQSSNDQRNIGSSFGGTGLEDWMKEVELKMEDNPNKTAGELMSDEEIADHLSRHESSLNNLKEKVLNHSATPMEEKIYFEGNADFERMISYLKEINRLPKEFENYL